jgi:hypothetical protein
MSRERSRQRQRQSGRLFAGWWGASRQASFCMHAQQVAVCMHARAAPNPPVWGSRRTSSTLRPRTLALLSCRDASTLLPPAEASCQCGVDRNPTSSTSSSLRRMLRDSRLPRDSDLQAGRQDTARQGRQQSRHAGSHTSAEDEQTGILHNARLPVTSTSSMQQGSQVCHSTCQRATG